MPRALVIDADPIGRNLVRMALERAGLAVQAATSPLELGATFEVSPFDVIAIGADEPGDISERFALQLRASTWRGTLVLAFSSIGAWDLPWVKAQLRPSAVFAKPLQRDEVDLRLQRILPTFCDDDDVEDAWDGALRSERKRFARTVAQREADLTTAIHEARRARDTAPLARAAELARELAEDAARYRMEGLAEVCDELHVALKAMHEGAVEPDDVDAWRDLSALADVIRGAPVERVLAQRTIDDSHVSRHDTVVLLVHQDISVLLQVAGMAERHRLGLVTARSVEEALRAMAGRRFDAVLVDEDLPDGGAAHLASSLHALEGRASVPLALMSSRAAEERGTASIVARAHAAPVTLRLPLTDVAFVQAVSNLSRRRVERRRRILILHADPTVPRGVAAPLMAEGVEVVQAQGAETALELVEQHAPDLVLLDPLGPLVSGLDVCKMLRADPRWVSLPVVFLTSVEDEALRDACLRVGADDVLPLPAPKAQLVTTALARIDRYRVLSRVDTELGIQRRAAFLAALDGRLATVGEAQRTVAIGLVKLEGLRAVNAQLGLSAGDQLLGFVGRSLEGGLGEHVDVARWSGSTLAVLLADETTSSASVVLHALVERIAARPYMIGGARVPLRLRVGVACTDRAGVQRDRLLAAAEVSLCDATPPRPESDTAPASAAR